MIYNDKITTEYGSTSFFIGSFPVAFQPSPTADNYKNGFFVRWFSKRINEVKAIEIDPATSKNIDQNLYTTVSLTWKISGPKDNKVANGIIQDFGVSISNKSEIERVKKETNVDLFKTLNNPLELWRGY